MVDYLTSASNTTDAMLPILNGVLRNADEIKLLYPPDEPDEDAALLVQAAVDAIGTGKGAINLASGYWHFLTSVTIHAEFMIIQGAGNTQIDVLPGVDAFVFEGRLEGQHPTYYVGDMTITGGRTAIRTTDPTQTARLIYESQFERLCLFNQSHAGFELGCAVYRSSWRNCHVWGDTTRPLYGISATAHNGCNNNKIDRCTFRGIEEAAIHSDNETAFGAINDLTIDTCLFENNPGQVASLKNARHVRFQGGWFELNCTRLDAEPNPLISMFGAECMALSLDDVWCGPVGAGAKDPEDSDRYTLVLTDNRKGHSFRGRLSTGYVNFGDDGHPVYGAAWPGKWIEMSCRQQLMQDATGAWFPVGLTPVLNAVTA